MIQFLIIIIGVAIILIPLLGQIKTKRKLTKTGISFIILCIIFAILQVFYAYRSEKNESKLLNDKTELKFTVDSLKTRIVDMSDSISRLKLVLISIDHHFGETSKAFNKLSKINDSLNVKLIETDRPIIVLESSQIRNSDLSANGLDPY